jgi:hypothetical protein
MKRRARVADARKNASTWRNPRTETRIVDRGEQRFAADPGVVEFHLREAGGQFDAGARHAGQFREELVYSLEEPPPQDMPAYAAFALISL